LLIVFKYISNVLYRVFVIFLPSLDNLEDSQLFLAELYFCFFWRFDGNFRSDYRLL